MLDVFANKHKKNNMHYQKNGSFVLVFQNYKQTDSNVHLKFLQTWCKNGFHSLILPIILKYGVNNNALPVFTSENP